jgi:Ser/Thr protein kinase RdoA (MazF antagonist)
MSTQSPTSTVVTVATPAIPDDVLAAFDRSGAHVAAFGSGLINKTFLVEDAGKPAIVVQRLHRIFGQKVNDDLDAVTAHLEKKGLLTPRLVRTISGASSVVHLTDPAGDADDADNRELWRAITRVDGTASLDKLATPAQAAAAGALVATFHGAVEDLSYAYQHVREGVHDTRKHLLALARSMAKHRKHRLGHSAGALGKEILDAGARLPNLDGLPLRHCHGDLKISNLLFRAPIDADAPEAVCLVDLDTLQKLSWPKEMGDALRSWCNPHGEDVEKTTIDVELFRGAVTGYFGCKKKPFLMPEETAALVDGLFTICVELAARFCADALEERYFGFDATRYKTRGDHNLVRARGQWSLAKSVRDRKDELNAIVAAAAR